MMVVIKNFAVMLTCLILILIGQKAGLAVDYDYDPTGRLVGVMYDDTTTESFSYDSAGNRLTYKRTEVSTPPNASPYAATDPSIIDQSTGVSTLPTLSWTGNGDPDTNDGVVYALWFGVPGSLNLVYTGQATEYSPTGLAANTEYCWRVVARDGSNAETPSPVWCFTTDNSVPEAAFSYTFVEPTLVQFHDDSSSTDDEIVTREWDFDNDGTPDSTELDPAVIYEEGGYQTVKLTVTDSNGAVTSTTKTILIDFDGDTIHDGIDNCIHDFNPDQEDSNGDNLGDVCSVTHCVGDINTLQERLWWAQNNGANDIILVQQGTYLQSENTATNGEVLMYYGREPYGLYIYGGYNADCSERTIDPDNTVVDYSEDFGQENGIMNLLHAGYQLNTHFLIDGITLQNGLNDRYEYADGGGLIVDINYDGDITLRNVIIRDNQANGAAGLFVRYQEGNLLLDNVAIVNNTNLLTDFGSGGILIKTINGKAEIRNSILGHNSGPEIGGISFDGVKGHGSLTMVNNLFYGNDGAYGGAFSVNILDGEGLLLHNTITDNHATEAGGGGLAVVDGSGSIRLYNNIIWGNTADNGPPDLSTFYLEGGEVSSYHNTFDTSQVGAGFVEEVDTQGSDPLFVDPANGDYRLQPSSDAIESGTIPPVGLVGYDFEGRPRNIDSDGNGIPVPDRGAYESPSPTDQDGDGLSDAVEALLGTSPTDSDTDDDGLLDSEEDINGNGIIDAGETSPLLADSDGDGVQDGTERGLTLEDIGPDTDPGVFIADQDPYSTTDPLNGDSDGDGLTDGEEDRNGNGRRDSGEQDPTNWNRTVFDDFSSRYIDSFRWVKGESVRLVEAGELRLDIGGRIDEWGNVASTLDFLDGPLLTSIEADIRLDAVQLQGVTTWGAAVAQIAGEFYDDDLDPANGGVWVTVGLTYEASTRTLAGGYSVISPHYSDFGVFDTPLQLGRDYPVKVDYDQSTNQIIFSVAGERRVAAVPAWAQDAATGNKVFNSMILGEDGTPVSGYVAAAYDNVFVNNQNVWYETFATSPLNAVLWPDWQPEHQREIRDEMLEIGILATGGNENLALDLQEQQTTDYLEAKIAIPSGNAITGAAIGQARIKGFFYNDSRGPGSGLDYDGLQGDVLVIARIVETSDGSLVPKATAYRLDSADGSADTELFDYTFPTQLSYDQQALMSIALVGSVLTVRCNDQFFDYTPATPLYPPSSKYHKLEVKSLPSAGAPTFMHARFDDVYTRDQFLPGDLNLDGYVGLEDAMLSLMVVSGDPVALSRHYRADVNGDGVIDTRETVYILNAVAAQ